MAHLGELATIMGKGDTRSINQRRIKVLEVLEGTVGGARKQVFFLATGLPKDQIEVHVACPPRRDAHFGDDHLVKDLTDAGIPVHIVPLVREISPLKDLAAYRALVALCRRERFDIVHGHCSKGGFLGRLAGRVAGSKTVFTPHTFGFQVVDCGRFKRGIYRGLERIAGGLTDALIAVSETERCVALESKLVPDERIHVICIAVDLQTSTPITDTDTMRREVGLPPGTLVVGFTGRFTPQKALHVLIDAFPRILRDVTNAHLLLVGSGELEGELRDQVMRLGLVNHVHFTGHRKDAMELLRIMDCFVLPSLYEGQSSSLLEAMAAGLPIVVTASPGNAEVVRDGENALVVPTNDRDALAAQVTAILTDSALGRRIGDAARTAIDKRLTPGEQIARHTALYRTLALGEESPGGTVTEAAP